MAVPYLPEGGWSAGSGGMVVSVHSLLVGVACEGTERGYGEGTVILVKPVPDHLARTNAAQLDAFAPPAFDEIEDGKGRPANLAFSGRSYGAFCFSCLVSSQSRHNPWKFPPTSKTGCTLHENTSDVRVRVVVPARVQGPRNPFEMNHWPVAVLGSGWFDLGDV